MKIFILTILLILLSLFGGTLALTNPMVTAGLVCAGWVTIAASLFCRPAPLWPALWPYCLAVLVSFAANLDILEVAGARMWLLAVAVALMFVGGRWVTGEELKRSLFWAGWALPVIFLAMEIGDWRLDNRNILAVWPVVFFLVGYQQRLPASLKLPYLLMHLIILLLLGSRGAMLGLVSGMLLFLAHPLAYPALITVLFILVTRRPETALNRLHYWQQALIAFQSNPLFGVGPAGITARSLITEPSGGFQLHAHNFIISSAAELGLIGVAALAYGAFTIYDLRFTIDFRPWQVAILVAILTHSLVDEPLFWPGPLLLAALVVGTIKKNLPSPPGRGARGEGEYE